MFRLCFIISVILRLIYGAAVMVVQDLTSKY